MVISKLDKFKEGTNFEQMIDEIDTNYIKSNITQIIFCSGKIYYELYELRAANNINNIAIIRIEQFYPFDELLFNSIVSNYKSLKKLVWCQEEPKNMGAWQFLKPILEKIISEINSGIEIQYIGRKEAASPSTGYQKVHQLEQQKIIKRALNLEDNK